MKSMTYIAQDGKVPANLDSSVWKFQTHISMLNFTEEFSDVCRHQYSYAFELDEDAPDVHTRYLRNKTVRFSSLSAPL